MPRHQAVADGLQPRQRQRVGQRPGPQRRVRLQQLGERVHAVGRDPGAVVAGQEVRVHHGIGRHQPLVAERALVARRPALADHRVPRRLAARAGRRRHRDERHRRAVVRPHPGEPLQVLDDAGTGAQQPGDRLGGVQHGAAPHAQHHVHGGLPVRCHGRVHHRRRRLVRDGDLARHRHPGGRQPRDQPGRAARTTPATGRRSPAGHAARGRPRPPAPSRSRPVRT